MAKRRDNVAQPWRQSAKDRALLQASTALNRPLSHQPDSPAGRTHKIRIGFLLVLVLVVVLFLATLICGADR